MQQTLVCLAPEPGVCSLMTTFSSTPGADLQEVLGPCGWMSHMDAKDKFLPHLHLELQVQEQHIKAITELRTGGWYRMVDKEAPSLED